MDPILLRHVKSKGLIREIGNIYPGLHLNKYLATLEILLTENVSAP